MVTIDWEWKKGRNKRASLDHEIGKQFKHNTGLAKIWSGKLTVNSSLVTDIIVMADYPCTAQKKMPCLLYFVSAKPPIAYIMLTLWMFHQIAIKPNSKI